MPKQHNNKFSLAIIVSVLLHLGLIAALGYSAWQYSSPYFSESNSDSIDAIMVDTKIMSESYQKQLTHKQTSEQIKQEQQKLIEQQARELQEKQLAEQQRLKELEKQRLLALEKQQKEAEAAALALAEKQKAEQDALKAKAELEAQKQQALIAQKKADEEAKIRAQKEQQEKLRIEQEKQKAELEKQKAIAEAEQAKQEAERLKKIAEQERLKVEQEKQKAAQEAQQKQDLDDILGGLTSNTPKAQQGVSTNEINQYQSQVQNAISSKFINPNHLYSGKNCILQIKLAADGLLLSVESKGGDPVLCREAISATKLATFPRPKSNLLYQQVKNLTIDFRPR